MKVTVRHDQGRLLLPPEIKLRAEITTLTVDIPPSALAAPQDPILQQAHAMLGPDYFYEPSDKTDQEILTAALLAKYGG